MSSTYHSHLKTPHRIAHSIVALATRPPTLTPLDHADIQIYTRISTASLHTFTTARALQNRWRTLHNFLLDNPALSAYTRALLKETMDYRRTSWKKYDKEIRLAYGPHGLMVLSEQEKVQREEMFRAAALAVMLWRMLTAMGEGERREVWEAFEEWVVDVAGGERVLWREMRSG